MRTFEQSMADFFLVEFTDFIETKRVAPMGPLFDRRSLLMQVDTEPVAGFDEITVYQVRQAARELAAKIGDGVIHFSRLVPSSGLQHSAVADNGTICARFGCAFDIKANRWCTRFDVMVTK